MEPAQPFDTRDLLSQLLVHANRSVSRVEFFGSISQLLLEASGCDSIQLLSNEQNHTYRCMVDRSDGGSVHFERRGHGADPLTQLLSPSASGLPLQEPRVRYVSTEHGSLFATDLQENDARSVALIPLEVGTERVGLLQLASRQAGSFTRDTIGLYERMAEPLAIALVHQRAQWALGERVKELTALYSIAQVAEEQVTLDEILNRIAAALPAGWQYPEVCSACIKLDSRVFDPSPAPKVVHSLVADIVVGGDSRGSVEIIYSDSRPEFDEGPFLVEERHLIDEVARLIAGIVERRQAEEDRSKLQEQLQHADRLATIGQLAAGVAHELNEPLGAVLGFAQLTRKCPRLPKQAMQDVDRIVKAALHAREVVKKLMNFGRPKPPQKRVVDINRLVQEALDFIRPRCDGEGIRMTTQLASDIPPVTVDPNQIQQVLINLVVNAIQAQPRGGTISISTSCAHDTVSLIVEDTGPGMSEDLLKRIFVPFFTTKDVGKGTGLGLTVVHGIVTSHGGEILVNSKLGKGTVFEVRLPTSFSTP